MNVPETFFTVSEELVLFGLSCLAGAVIGVFYDIFRVIRIIFPHNDILILIEDIIFLVGYVIFFMAFSSVSVRGEMRGYYILGNIIGFVIYFFTVGSAVTGAVRKLFLLLKKIFIFIASPFRAVFAFICKKLSVKFVGNSKIFAKCFKKSNLLLLKPYCLLYNKMENSERKNVTDFGSKKE
ncbi:MAG: spore cortex biosynthesis protein YabQ [Ruminococcus sp.]|nr:spore cortex biosynthesis protein YabQ [Ruminococcus sp.]